MRIKDQETRLNLHEHNDDDDDDENGIELNDCILSSIISSSLYAHSTCSSKAVMYFGKGGSVEGLCVETIV